MRDRDVPLDEEGFTRFMAERFKQALPDYRITIAGPLTLKVVDEDGEESIRNLERALDFCRHKNDGCAEWLDSYVENARAGYKDIEKPIDRGMLRPVVRRKDYIERLGEEYTKEMVVEPLTNDLVAVCYVDMPTAMRSAVARDFKALGLSQGEAMAQARANLAAGIADFEASFEHTGDDIGVIGGDVYISSWLALPDAWRRTVALFDGKLIVSVPAFDVLLYMHDTGSDAVEALREAAEDEADNAEWPLSTTVYRWTPQGWRQA